MTKQLPSYERIFGEIDFKKGDEARSVYSPAAYLADLLQLMDDEFKSNSSHSFDQRRSDIKEILLDAKNTFEMLPYLDRVNEILESKIKNDSTGKEKEEASEQIRKAFYPFNLPQDIDYATVKVYLQHLGVKAEELYQLFEEMPQPELLAKAYLGILEEQWFELVKDIVPDTRTDVEKEANIQKCYGKKFNDLYNSTYGLDIDQFLDSSKISEIELQELIEQNLSKSEELSPNFLQFYTNDPEEGYATFSTIEGFIGWEGLSGIGARKGLTHWLEKAHRFIRLAKKIGFTFTELDIVLRSCCNNELNAEALTRIAVVHWLKKKLELEVDEICAFFKPCLNILGQGNEEMPIDLFNRVYNNRCAIADKQYIWNHENEPQQFKDAGLSKFIFNKDNKDILYSSNDSYRKRVAHSLDLPNKQLTYLIKKFRSHLDNDKLWNTETEERSMLTTFYRVSKLANICEISLEELFIIFDILEKDPAVRQFKNCHVLIDFKIDERDCYKIISALSASCGKM